MLWIIPALPLAAVALNLLFGDRLGKRGTTLLSCGAVIAAFGFALRSVLHLASLGEAERQLTERAWTWMHVGDFSVDVSFLLDPLSAVCGRWVACSASWLPRRSHSPALSLSA